MRHKRLMASLDEKARERLWWSNGSSSRSETSASSSPELADLVDSFYGDDDGAKIGDDGFNSALDSGFRLLGREKKRLEKLLVVGEGDLIGTRIKEVVEMAAERPAPEEKESKRWIMSWLRYRGFDAGLCKSLPTTTSRSLSINHHQYVDVITSTADRSRYMVELNLAAEFEIARPTPEYSLLLNTFPAVFVGKPETLREVVEVMCNAAKESMQRRDMHVPPWRRKEYMVGKWFGSCKRTINPRPKRKKSNGGDGGGGGGGGGGGTEFAGEEDVVNCGCAGGGWKWRGMEAEKIGVYV